MIDKLGQWAEHWSFWVAVIVTVIGMEGVALYMQYVLDQQPCRLCIHVRAYLLVVLMSGVMGLVWNSSTRQRKMLGQTLVYLVGMVGLVGAFYSGWQAYQMETNIFFGTCSFDAGFPAWFALDEWIPSLFAPTATCGKATPFLFGMSLNEAIMYSTGSMMLIASAVFFLNVLKNMRKMVDL